MGVNKMTAKIPDAKSTSAEEVVALRIVEFINLIAKGDTAVGMYLG